MMHEEQRIQISQYVDGELDATGEREVFEHLTECEECRGFLRRSMRLRADLMADPHRIGEGRPSQPLTARSIPAPHSSSFIRRRVSVPMPVAAVFGLFLVVSILMLTKTQWGGEEKNTQTVYVTTLPGVSVQAIYRPIKEVSR